MSCRHDEGPGHNCAYVDKRNELIPVAEGIANAKVGAEAPGTSRDDDEQWSRRWDAAFHHAMTRLTSDPFIAGRLARLEGLH